MIFIINYNKYQNESKKKLGQFYTTNYKYIFLHLLMEQLLSLSAEKEI